MPGEIGPTGGPALTDVLGVLESWTDGVLRIRTAEDDVVEIPAALVVSGKPVPPRPSRFSRMSAEEVERRCVSFSLPTVLEELGDWLLRVTDGTNPMASAALLVGDPGVQVDEALEAVMAFYARHGRRPVARVIAESRMDLVLVERGWSPLMDDRADNEVHLVGVAALLRHLRDVDTSAVVQEPRLTYDWLVGNDRARANFAGVAAALDLSDAAFGSISDGQHQVARARANMVDGWSFLADLFVQPEHRRRGRARSMMAGMAAWSAEHGASVMALQVRAENAAAQALYASLGFERHHGYRYLTG